MLLEATSNPVPLPGGDPYFATPAGLFWNAKIDRCNHHYDQALAGLDKAVAADSRHAAALLERGIIFDLKGDHPSAIAAFRKCEDAAPAEHFAHYNLGVVLARTGDLAGAERAFKKSVDASPKLVRGWVSLGQTLEIEKQPDKALGAYRRALEGEGHTNPTAHQRITHILFDQKKYGEAWKSGKKALESGVDSIDIYEVMCRSNFATKSYAQSMQYAQEGAIRAPAYQPFQSIIGQSSYRLKKFDQAKAPLEQAIAMDPKDADAQLALGLTLIALGQKDAAAAMIPKLKAINADAGAQLEAALPK
jgi:tetratricopeptide (TPR) repeat protein